MENKDKIFNELGQLTRQLYDVLKELGIGDTLSHSTLQLPDAEDRLLFIARATEESAHRVLNMAESAQKILADMTADIPEGASQEWQDRHKARLVALSSMQNTLIESQEYQDLTGQVLKKMTETIKQLQRDLAHILLLYQDHTKPKELSGPALHDLQSRYTQADVDKLLGEMGF